MPCTAQAQSEIPRVGFHDPCGSLPAQDIPWIWKAPGTQCPAGAEANLAAFPWNILAFLLIPTACLSCFPEGHVPATSVATRMGIPFFLNSEMTLFLSLWSMSPWSSPRLWSSCLRLLASSSALAFLVTKRRTLPEDVNSTRRRVSQFHLLGPEGKISTIWVTSSFAWGQKCPQSQEGGSNTQTSTHSASQVIQRNLQRYQQVFSEWFNFYTF